MTKCGKHWKVGLRYKRNDDFDGYCEFCETDRAHLREEWQMLGLIDNMQICMDDIIKLPADALRPLIRKENEAIIPDVLPKVRSYLKNGHKLTRLKTEEFVARARGVCKGPPPKVKWLTCEYCLMSVREENVVSKNGHAYCSEEHAKLDATRRKPKEKIKLTTYGEQLLKKTRAERQAMMHPRESKADWDLFLDLQDVEQLKEQGWRVVFQKRYVLMETWSDVSLENDELNQEVAFFNDHPKTHPDSDKDTRRRRLLEGRIVEGRKVRAVGLLYKDDTVATRKERVQKVLDEVNTK
jgi:hypothetical protein